MYNISKPIIQKTVKLNCANGRYFEAYRVNQQCCPGGYRPETDRRPHGDPRTISAGTTLLVHTVVLLKDQAIACC